MLTILTYHSIDNLGLITSVRPDRFAAQMAFLAEHQYQMLAMGEVVDLLNSDRPIPRRCATLTFDDGYRSVYTVALEHLRRYSFPATVFVTSGHCGKLSNWPSHAPRFSSQEILTAAELRELRASRVTIGAHTINHHHLTRLPLAQAQREIEDSQAELEQIVGDRVRHFAYPYGELNDALRAFVASHFDSACGTDLRLARHGDDIYNLPRINTYYLDDLLRLGGPQARTGRAYIGIRRSLRAVRKALTRDDGSQY
jgi:peptidoglycan/xylan/chitin deacetylase (PgdA/CDA1 family)